MSPGNKGIPLSEWSGSGATDRLRETMIELSGRTEHQTTWLVRLTCVLTVATIALVVLTVVLVVRG